jgi:(2Fe-2S) ferredoxin
MPREFRKQVFCCTTEGEGKCATKGGVEVWQKFKEEVAKRGLTDVIVTRVGCTGQHAVGPTVIVHPDGLWYKQVTPNDVAEILDKHIQGGQPVERLINPEMRVKAD